MHQTPVRQRIVCIGGARALLLESGDGPAVVLLASTLVLARSYLPTVHELAKRFRVFVVEFPGSGRGTRLRPAWSFDHYSDWTNRLLERMDLRDVTLIGHSNSGPVAVLAALSDEQRRIARLVLEGTIGAEESFSLLRTLAGRTVDCFHEPILTLTGWPHVVFNSVFHARNFFEQVRLSARTDIRPEFSKLNVPTLLAWGARDNTMPLRSAHVLRAIRPSSQLYICRDGSHDWLITHAAEFARMLDRFVAQS